MLIDFRRVLTAFLLVGCMSGLLRAMEHTHDSLEAVKKNVAGRKAVLVDVREEAEWDQGHLKRSISFPLSELDDLSEAAIAKKLPKKKIIYTFCVSGSRALTVGEELEKIGYQVRPLKPGYRELVDAGFEKASE